MKKIILVVVIGVISWQLFEKNQGQHFIARDDLETANIEYISSSNSLNSAFKCDGRTHCSQMTSCEEAAFFLKNCPGVKMDGDNDGVPCEKQWCE